MYEIRRKEKTMSNERTLRLLETGMYGTLAVYDGETAYCVPLNYVHAAGNVYFHCAKQGHKLDALAHCRNVCMSVVGRADAIDGMTMDYESVCVFGEISLVEDPAERLEALRLLALKHYPGQDEMIDRYIEKDEGRCIVLKLAARRITGKGTPE